MRFSPPIKIIFSLSFLYFMYRCAVAIVQNCGRKPRVAFFLWDDTANGWCIRKQYCIKSICVVSILDDGRAQKNMMDMKKKKKKKLTLKGDVMQRKSPYVAESQLDGINKQK